MMEVFTPSLQDPGRSVNTGGSGAQWLTFTQMARVSVSHPGRNASHQQRALWGQLQDQVVTLREVMPASLMNCLIYNRCKCGAGCLPRRCLCRSIAATVAPWTQKEAAVWGAEKMEVWAKAERRPSSKGEARPPARHTKWKRNNE